MGPAQGLPGFEGGYPFSLLPFWGVHCLVDFMLAHFAAGPAVDTTIVLDEYSRGAALPLSSRWKKPVARVHVLEGGLGELARLVSACGSDHVVLASLSSISILDAGALLALSESTGDLLAKVSVAQTPVEIYCSGREHLGRLLEGAAARAATPRPLRKSLFDAVLHQAIDRIEDLPGDLLFQADLMGYYASNLWLAVNGASRRYHSTVSRLPELADWGSESRIAEKGIVRDSWLAAGVEVEGTVEHSVIFPNVQIRRGAHVSRSVVLNGNRIGAGAEIHNALVLPLGSESPRTSANIGERCSIGARGSTARNAGFPDQIRDGVAVIGTNAEIPSGFRAEAASYVAPGVAASVLRKMKLLKKGASVFGNRTDLPREGAVTAGAPR